MLSLSIALLGLPPLLFYLYSALHYRRMKQFAAYPQLKPSLIWGHLRLVNEFLKKRGQKGGQSDFAFGDMCESIGNPPVLFLDLRPATAPMLVLRTHYTAEQVSRQSKMWPYSTPKSDLVAFLLPLLGEKTLLFKSGSDWKELRRHYNPGFAPQYLMSLMPVILEKTKIFISRLDSYASTGEIFELEPLCTGLTFDIIGAVVMDVDLDAQLPEDQQAAFIKDYKEFVLSYKQEEDNIQLWESWHVKRQRKALSRSVDGFLIDLIRRKFEAVKETKDAPSRSILALSLRDTEILTKEIIDLTKDQIKTFMFAGHDTTSILLQWALYEISRTPFVLKTLREELKSLFGSDLSPEAIRDGLLSRGEEIIPKMTYTSAVIKETLRLYPPAATGRRCPQGSNFYIHLPDGSSFCVDGMVLYNCAALIQRDAEVYGDTKDDFVPARWLGDTDTSMATNADEKVDVGKVGGSGIPSGAWRPFERGPRNCIGQELANIEARVILASVVGTYDFEKVGLGEATLDAEGKPVIDEKGQHQSRTKLYNTRQVTARPVDGMKVRVKHRDDLLR